MAKLIVILNMVSESISITSLQKDQKMGYNLKWMCFSVPQFLILGRKTENMQWRQPNSVKGRTVCNIVLVCAINPQLIFLGHLSAGSYLHCSNLSAYYVTHWPTLPYMLSVIFHSAYAFSWIPTVWMQVKLTGFEAGISQLKYSGCRWNSIKKRRANIVRA